jgi:hypothetical protein
VGPRQTSDDSTRLVVKLVLPVRIFIPPAAALHTPQGKHCDIFGYAFVWYFSPLTSACSFAVAISLLRRHVNACRDGYSAFHSRGLRPRQISQKSHQLRGADSKAKLPVVRHSNKAGIAARRGIIDAGLKSARDLLCFHFSNV